MDSQICPACGEANPTRFRLCGFCGSALAPALPPNLVRKIVTLVFVDLKGSTNLGERLDPEALHEVKERYFKAMAGDIARHGGTIEKYIGDAIMAVFGLPQAHDDDALRAVRAADAMKSTLARLNEDLERTYGVHLANRTGVNTGMVVANANRGADQRLATGDAVNVAARLEQAAPEDEVLIGPLTYDLVRDAVDVETLEPLAVKGKSEPLAAYRLLRVRGESLGRARRDDAPMVGRDDELSRLRTAFADTLGLGAASLTVVVGDAGVGKSRLVREFVTSVAERADVLWGRCLSYGDGITFWPLVEIVRSAAGIHDEDTPDAARSRLLGLVGDRDVADRVASIVGLSSSEYALPELFWGARRLFELLAARRPLVVVVDDVHWAEPTFLDLLDHVLEAAEASVMLICTARHDLVESRPEWPSLPNAGRMILDSLSDADAANIIEGLLGHAGLPVEAQDRILAAAEGNPLYVEQMVSMLVESGALRLQDGRWHRADESVEFTIPPTIQALLAARLDQLPPDERAVIEPASVIGLQFEEPAVTELASHLDRSVVVTRLANLTAKRYVRPTGTLDGTYRFQHLLIRDEAYHRILKRARASLHERFVAWADRVNDESGRGLEFQEILGFHLEQAYLYLAELAPVDNHGRLLGADASRRLTAAGRRAFARGDMHAAAGLLRRAAGLLPVHAPERLWLLPDLGEALTELGEFDSATAVLDEAALAAAEISDGVLAAHATLMRHLVGYYAGRGGDWSQRVVGATERALAVLGPAGDHAGQARAWRLLVGVRASACQFGDAASAAEQVVAHARSAGDARLAARGMSGYAIAALYGPMPVASAIERCEAFVSELSGDRRTEGLIRGVLAELYAMNEEFGRARETYELARTTLEQLGPNILAAATSTNSWRVEMLAGDPDRAERELRRDFAALEKMGEQFLLSSVAGALAQVRFTLGDAEEADQFSRITQELAGEDDVEAQAQWRTVRAKVLAQRGSVSDRAQVDRLIVEALSLVRPTQAPTFTVDVLLDAAEVMRLTLRDEASADLLAEALALLEAKGNHALAARVADAADAQRRRWNRKSGSGRPHGAHRRSRIGLVVPPEARAGQRRALLDAQIPLDEPFVGVRKVASA